MAKTIGIIGAGLIGEALAKKFVDAGHTVKIANSTGPSSPVLQKVAAATGATAATAHDAAAGVDVLVVTITLKNVPLLAKDLLDHTPKDAVIIDTNNYYPVRDGEDGAVGELKDPNVIEAEWIQKHLGRGDRKVVKVFNNIFSSSLANNARPKGDPNRIALPISGDIEAHRHIVAALVDQIGFDPVDVGPIANSWRFEPGTPAYTSDLSKESLVARLAEADKSKKLESRKKANDFLISYLASLQQK